MVQIPKEMIWDPWSFSTDVFKFLRPLMLLFIWTLSGLGHIYGICFPLGAVVKGPVPQAGIHTAASASGLRTIPRTMWHFSVAHESPRTCLQPAATRTPN